MKIAFISMIVTLLTGCTSITVSPPDASVKMNHVVIQDNPKVIVKGFVDVMRDGFDRHGISSEIASADVEIKPSAFVVTYTALRSWDLAPYLSKAEIRIRRFGKQVAYAEYHLKGKGGYSLYKWQGVKAKMDPVMDQLLAGVSAQPDEHQTSESNLVEKKKEGTIQDDTLYAKLTKLDELRRKGIITEQEFETQKQKILEN